MLKPTAPHAVPPGGCQNRLCHRGHASNGLLALAIWDCGRMFRRRKIPN